VDGSEVTKFITLNCGKILNASATEKIKTLKFLQTKHNKYMVYNKWTGGKRNAKTKRQTHKTKNHIETNQLSSTNMCM
jgi:hypothetical protein